ncbi:unnamed protein product [Oppiella nova]|uniref:Uncharacterized protein n=1 Tax=Oppiella nova TaxID=334625 RepID=A0A7R9QP27_9ACAR|nr:unnamed protein product [Oppiella nova]CAG2169802.1 unnamed protein product [Oppiella nova]
MTKPPKPAYYPPPPPPPGKPSKTTPAPSSGSTGHPAPEPYKFEYSANVGSPEPTGHISQSESGNADGVVTGMAQDQHLVFKALQILQVLLILLVLLLLQDDRPTRDPWDSLSWWRNEDQARRIEEEHNQQHPNSPIRVEVVDTFASNETIDSIFNYGLLIIPSLFLVSATLWCISRFLLRTAISLYLGYSALVLASIASIAFVVFGLIFLIGMCSGYKFEYHSVEQMPNANPINYTVVSLPITTDTNDSNQSPEKREKSQQNSPKN